MTTIEFTNQPTVKLVDHMGDDLSIARAARVSVIGENEGSNPDSDAGLINYLLKSGHGSPFEQNSITFYIEAPLFVLRQMDKHRAGWSNNETSGRYRKLEPRFYVPSIDRPMKNVGGSARPKMEPLGNAEANIAIGNIVRASRAAWNVYEEQIQLGVANELARSVLPLNLMSQRYATCNVRSLMHFLSLRTSGSGSHPQLEVEQVAKQMEEVFSWLFPASYDSYTTNGRIAP